MGTPPPSGSVPVLIVDDEPALLKMMRIYLQRLGFDVTTVETTGEASVLDPSAFAVAVLDASMAGLSTTDLALQMLSANHSLRVIVASGYPVSMSDLEAATPGRVAFLHKPFTPDMLAAAIRRMLGPQEEKPL